MFVHRPRRWANIQPTLAQRLVLTGSSSNPLLGVFSLVEAFGIVLDNPVNTKHLYNICTMLNQRRRRWDDVVQMLYKSFVFAGNAP